MNRFPKQVIVRGDKIGRGAFWKVYEGKVDDTRCAIKRWSKAFVPDLEDFEKNRFEIREKILHECTLWSSLSNANVVKFHGIFFEDEDNSEMNIPCLVIEIMDKSLASHIKCTSRNRIVLFPLKVKVAILQHVSKALEYLHSVRNLLHGDLTASNILLKEERPGYFIAKVSDFGMSRLVNESEPTTTNCGTMCYMPPEFHNKAQLSLKVDIFSFGVLIIHTLVHVLPRPSTATILNEAETLVAVSEYKRYSHYLSDLRDEEKLLIPMIESCLQYNPKNRPSPEVLTEKLEDIDARIMIVHPFSSEMESLRSEVVHTLSASIPQHATTVYFTGPVVSGSTIGNSTIHLESVPQKRDYLKDEHSVINKMPRQMSARYIQVSDKDKFSDYALEFKWEEKPDCISDIFSPVTVYFNGKIFVGERRWRYHNGLYIFDVVNKKWSQIQFHGKREMCRFAMAMANHKLYILGGDWKMDSQEEECSCKVFCLDCKNIWDTSAPSLKQGRYNATATGFDVYILIAGGRNCANEVLSSVEVVDMSLPIPMWYEVCCLPTPSYHMQCTILGESIFLGLGVYTAKLLYTAKLTKILSDLKHSVSRSAVSQTFWELLPELPIMYSGLCSFKDCLITVGGRNNHKGCHQNSTLLYNRSQKTWTDICPLAQARSSCACSLFSEDGKTQIYVMCGHGATKSVESCVFHS